VIGKAVLLLATTLVIAGCGAVPTSAGPHTSSSPGLSPSASLSSSPRATVSTVSPTCEAAVMSDALGKTGAATGHDSRTFVLTNGGSGPCSLEGYPTVQLVGATGDLPTTETDGFNPYLNSSTPTPELVTVPSGGQASFDVQSESVTTGTQECDQTSDLAIQLPGGGGTLTYSIGIIACGGIIWVSPIFSGSSPPVG